MRAFPLPLILACGCGIALVSLGERTSFGLFQTDMTADRVWGRETFALAFAIQNLVWGLGQPIAGALADRFGTMKVLISGGILYVLGLLGTVQLESAFAFYLAFGVMIGLASAAFSFTIVLSSFGRSVSPEKRTLAFGLGTAAGSLGMFVFGPLGATLIASYGWEAAIYVFAAIMFVTIFFTIPLQGKGSDTAGSQQSIGDAMREAFGYKSYVLLVIGFFVCGFHVAFIIAHMPAYLQDIGLGPQIGGIAIALIGLFNVAGSLAAGAIGQRFSKAYSLSTIYLLRSVVITVFVLTPVSPASVIVFSSLMGLLWLSTIPLTSGLVAVMFGPRYMATLFGFVFFSHQVGSFFGVWLGGVIYEQTGSYDMLWWSGVLLGVLAALVHLPIRDAPAPRLATAAAP